ncbi:Uncharacterized protein ALO54_05386, partial [Pseudomonas syringae pv. philadelphi]
PLKPPPNKHLYVEADSLYMFATKGHMGFTGATALSYLLSGNPAQGWGPWHESGHQRQLSPMNWEDMTEVTVNIYSLATQERMEGRASRLDVEYPVIKEYLNSPHREFSRLPNHFQRVAMLWQLHLTFRTGFYPQLHQRYRLMQNLPQGSEDVTSAFYRGNLTAHRKRPVDLFRPLGNLSNTRDAATNIRLAAAGKKHLGNRRNNVISDFFACSDVFS